MHYLNSYDSYDDLFNTFGTDLQAATRHYITFGSHENRNPNLCLSDRYIASYPDLIEAFHYDLEAGVWHYPYFGKTEKRQVSFDPQVYLDRHSNLSRCLWQ